MERAEYEVMAAVEAEHWWYGGMRSIAAALLDQVYDQQSDLRILDAGCGTGGNGVFLRRYGDVVGMDLAAEALDPGKERLPGHLVRGSVNELPFDSNSFDLVTSFDVLYHRAVSDEIAALHEVRRVLKPLGRLLIRLPAYEFLRAKHDRSVHTRRRYTAGAVHHLLAEAGFFVEHLSYANTLLFPIPLMQRLVERVVPSLEQKESDLTLPAPPINMTLRWPLAVESALLEMGCSLPFGLSIVALAHSGKYEQVLTPQQPMRAQRLRSHPVAV